jgi:hypothetical protein
VVLNSTGNITMTFNPPLVKPFVPSPDSNELEITKLSFAVQRAFISGRFHGGVFILKTKNQIKTKS